MAGEVASRYVVEPVDLTTGRKVIPDEIDFSLPGLMPIEWTRFYASDLAVDSVLGRGWVLPWEQSLRRQDAFIYLVDNQGRAVPFVTLEPGQRIYNPHERSYPGDYDLDFEAANHRAGLNQKTTPTGYVWHHVNDYDPITNKGTMQLVEQPAHSGISRKGGVSQYIAATGKAYIHPASKRSGKPSC